MATNPPKGPGRKGSVRKRIQVLNTKTKRFVKINTDTNLFMDNKKEKNKTFKGVRKKK